MISVIYDDFYIRNHEIIFYTFIGVIVLIILLTIIFVLKEVKNVNK